MAEFFVAFIGGYLDSGLGGGYGTILSPILIVLGHAPLKVIPAVLVSQLMIDSVACFVHHRCNNVDLHFKSKEFRIALTIGTMSLIGVIASVFVALTIPQRILTLYIGLLVVMIGVIVFASVGKVYTYSWKKIVFLGIIASFNKGISGGGFGPVLSGGQVLSGVDMKNVVGITAFAKAMTCLAGFILYVIMGRSIDWPLIGILVLGALPAVVGAGLTVKHIQTCRLKKVTAVFMVLLGILTLCKIGGK